MKRLVITQYGQDEITYERMFVVELPADMNESELDVGTLGELADDAGIEWERNSQSGIEGDHQEIEGTPEEWRGGDGLPVVQFPVDKDDLPLTMDEQMAD